MDENLQSVSNTKSQPTVLVIFGINGNLSQKKLMPALYNLVNENALPEDFKVVGIFRDGKTSLNQIIQNVEIEVLRKHEDCDPNILEKLKSIIEPLELNSVDKNEYSKLKSLLESIDNSKGIHHQRLFYLAIPPDIFPTIITCIGETGINVQNQDYYSKIILEKPFGFSLESARQLVEYISRYFSERQIYRIDHYLAQETAQNILTFRFSNPLVEDLWGRQFIDHIQISALEEIDIEGRGSFYESMGALRDIIQNHLMQILSLTLMESPITLDSNGIHEEKLALLKSIEQVKLNHVDEIAVRGQYEGYKEDVNNPNSKVETYAAIALQVSNSRWGGVPILLRTGKALKSKMTEINVIFKERARRNSLPNVLTIRIQPNEGIGIRLVAKKPGFKNEVLPVNMDFSYHNSFNVKTPDPYERVLADAIFGDQTLFATSEEVIRSWEILEPILEYWQFHPSSPTLYAKGSMGPSDADALSKSFGTEWIN